MQSVTGAWALYLVRLFPQIFWPMVGWTIECRTHGCEGWVWIETESYLYIYIPACSHIHIHICVHIHILMVLFLCRTQTDTSGMSSETQLATGTFGLNSLADTSAGCTSFLYHEFCFQSVLPPTDSQQRKTQLHFLVPSQFVTWCFTQMDRPRIST